MRVGLGLGLGPIGRPGRQADDEDEVPRKYLFIDGEFFRSFVQEMKEAAKPEHGELEIALSAVGSGYDRVFFYDAYPEKKDSQSDDEFETERERTEAEFSQISTTRNFSVRPALTRRGQRRQQKGVDVLLAIECLMHAIRNNIDEATIMTSDLDFFPLFEALLQTKTKSVLRYQIGKTSRELIQAADYAEPLTSADFLSWLGPDHSHLGSSLSVNKAIVNSAKELASGKIADKPFKLMWHDDSKRYFSLIDGRVTDGMRRSRLFVEGLAEKRMRAKIQYDSLPK